MSRVDLPIPGSPPTRITEPRTNPPPVTRSNSAIPEGSLGASCASPARGSSAKRRPLPGLRPGPAGRSAPSSLRVFHSPHASHLPCQRLEAAPQFWQTKVRVRLDIRIAQKAATNAKAPTRTIQEHFKEML